VSAIVAVSHLLEQPKPIALTPAKESSEQLNRRIADLQNELAKAKAVQKQDQTGNEQLTTVAVPRKPMRSNEVATNAGTVKVRNLRKPLTRLEREELAADLGLVAARDEDDLDLVTDTINQSP
jgi:hypothetical protein